MLNVVLSFYYYFHFVWELICVVPNLCPELLGRWCTRIGYCSLFIVSCFLFCFVSIGLRESVGHYSFTSQCNLLSKLDSAYLIIFVVFSIKYSLYVSCVSESYCLSNIVLVVNCNWLLIQWFSLLLINLCCTKRFNHLLQSFKPNLCLLIAKPPKNLL